MSMMSLLRAASLSAIGAALAVTALPVAAQDDGRQRVRGENRAERSPEQREAAMAARQQARQERRAAAQQGGPEQRAYQAQQRASGDWNRGDRRSATATATERSGRDWNRRDNTSNDWGQARAAQVQAQAQARAAARAQAQAGADARVGTNDWNRRSRDAATTGTWQRNGTYTNRDRNQTYRDGYRDGRQRDAWRDQRQQQNAYRDGYRDGDRNDRYRDGSRSGYRDGYRSWNRDWRQNNRYNWYGYRQANRHLYSLGRYYSPYRDYRYSRLSIGFRLGSLFYGSRYWINDPWQYRLPEAYGGYRWIRYYDDALLVDTYTGEVVDVVYDFFW